MEYTNKTFHNYCGLPNEEEENKSGTKIKEEQRNGKKLSKMKERNSEMKYT